MSIISERAVLVRLNISVWTANKLDRTATNQVLAHNKAASNAAQVRKNLMAGTRERKDISDFAAMSRLWHNQWSLPWADVKGDRLLPTSLFLDYKSQQNVRKAEFIMKVSKFKDNYSTHIENSKLHLGDLFNQSDYPSREELNEKFKWVFTVTPVPASGHFLVDLPAEEMEEMRASCDADVERRVEEAVEAARERFHKQVSDMSEKLVETDGDTKKRWHDTFLTNPQELCRMLTHLNVTNDPDLEKARKELEATVTGASIDELKDSPVARERMKGQVDSILDNYKW